MYNFDKIKRVHLEITQRCQAACPMCDRNEDGGPDNRHITNAELSLEDCKKIFAPDFVRQLDVMFMCGHLGDPIIAQDSLKVMQYFRREHPHMWLSMNTNGGARSADYWKGLADATRACGCVIFSVDGLADTNHLYRQNVQWEKVERNMRTFIEAGGRAYWDYIVFAHNEHQVEYARALAEQWGVEQFRVKKSARFFDGETFAIKKEKQAQNRRGEETQLIEMPKQLDYQNLALQQQAEIENTYGSMRNYYDSCQIKCKVLANPEIYITAEGLFMPCCWTAGRMYKWWHPDPRVEQIWEHIEAAGGKAGLDVINNELRDVVDGPLMRSITASWHKKSLAEGKLGVCAMKCGEEHDPFKSQFL